MSWKLIFVRFPIGKRCEGFDERAERDGFGGILPTKKQESAAPGIEEKIRDIVARELAFKNENSRLAKERFRRRRGILDRESLQPLIPGKSGCHRERRDDQTRGYSQRAHS